MKKCIPVLFSLVLLALILQIVTNIFVKDKYTEYIVTSEDNKYKVYESMKIVDDISYYDFKIVDKNNNIYIGSSSADLNKQTEIIKSISSYTNNGLTCIFPVYKRDLAGDLSCLYNGQQVSYSYLKQINNADVSLIIDKLNSLGYKNKKWENNEVGSKRLDAEKRYINVYQDNILKDYTFLMWQYKGLYILKNDDMVVKEYLEYDQYDNKLSALVGKYYVTADLGVNNNYISELTYYNTKEYGSGTIPLLNNTSNNFYFNGVYDNKLYMTDVGNEKQYAISPAYEKVTEVGSRDTKFVTVENGKLVNVEAKEFLKEKVYFNYSIKNENINSKFGEDIKIIKNRKFYYFKANDGSFYRAHEDSIDNPELLFKFSDVTEWKVKDGDILVVVGDKLYFYNDVQGLILIAINNELKYNHFNICDFWKK